MTMFPAVLFFLSFGASDAVIAPEDLIWLEDFTRDVFDASRVHAGESVGGIGPNTTGGTLIRPGGRECYPAFWIRDYVMALNARMVPPEEQRHMLLLTLEHQADKEVALKTGSIIPPGAIPDHISFGGVPIFFPGNLQDYDTQGGERWGRIPCLDDQFFFVAMLDQFVRQAGDGAIADIPMDRLWPAMLNAYAMPPAKSGSGLVACTSENRGVNFGFFDTTVHTGELLFASLLKYRAALVLHDVGARLNYEGCDRYAAEAREIQAQIPVSFAQPGGWLRASTGTSAQIDVWGTAYAVYLGALAPDRERAACEALANALRDDTIAWRGMIRHVPVNTDFSPESAWEVSYARKNTYQNGAYWPTPTGWVAYAVGKVDRALARRLVADYMTEMREGDFRKGSEFGAPWECRHPDGGHRQNPVYLTSVACPLAAFRRIIEEDAAQQAASGLP